MRGASSPEAAVFLRRLSSVIVSSFPSESCAVDAVVGVAVGEAASWEELAICGGTWGGSGIGEFVG